MKTLALALIAVVFLGCTGSSRGEFASKATASGGSDEPQICIPIEQCTQSDIDNGLCCCPDGCCPPQSPILVDLGGGGLDLTSPQEGVRYTLVPGQLAQWAWTEAAASNAFLVLDLDGNGAIDSGAEMFGNLSPQVISAEPNGFRALAIYDLPGKRGNGDGVLDPRDAIWPDLRLWRDADHDGFSDGSEMITLDAAGIHLFELSFSSSSEVDEHGNEFRYKSTIVADAPASPVVNDVWLQQEPVADDPQACQTETKCTAWVYVPIGPGPCGNNPGGHGASVAWITDPSTGQIRQAELFTRSSAITLPDPASDALRVEMTAAARFSLGDRLEGIPGCRVYPMPDPFHTPTEPGEYHVFCAYELKCGGCGGLR